MSQLYMTHNYYRPGSIFQDISVLFLNCITWQHGRIMVEYYANWMLVVVKTQ